MPCSREGPELAEEQCSLSTQKAVAKLAEGSQHTEWQMIAQVIAEVPLQGKDITAVPKGHTRAVIIKGEAQRFHLGEHRKVLLPLTAFLLWILASGEGGGEGRQSRCEEVELIFFWECSSERSTSFFMGRPAAGCLYRAYCSASVIHLISLQISSICWRDKNGEKVQCSLYPSVCFLQAPESLPADVLRGHFRLRWSELPLVGCLLSSTTAEAA